MCGHTLILAYYLYFTKYKHNVTNLLGIEKIIKMKIPLI